MATPVIKSLYYITHIDNLPSILEEGILSHRQVEDRRIPFVPIYDGEIVSKRRDKSTPEKESLWEYANLYFQARNPMMYRVVKEKDINSIAVIGIKPSVLSRGSIVITDGNAASDRMSLFTRYGNSCCYLFAT